jgi:membrane protein YqaA with SNARE-associated domain
MGSMLLPQRAQPARRRVWEGENDESREIPEEAEGVSREDFLSLIVLFAWSFAAATILPLSSEVPLAVVVRHSGGWLVPVLVATAGNALGACSTYWLARGAVAAASPTSEKVRHASALLARYGPPAMLLSWVPLIGDVLVALAGAARMPFWSFAAWTAAGKCARYVAVALAVDQL